MRHFQHEMIRNAVERGKWRSEAVVVAVASLLLRLVDKQHLGELPPPVGQDLYQPVLAVHFRPPYYYRGFSEIVTFYYGHGNGLC